MKVFKTCLLIARRCIGILISFVIIFLFISIFTSKIQGDAMESAFKGEAVPYAIINRGEETPLTEGLRTYLQTQSEEVRLPDDEMQLQEALFYEEVDYIIIIPEGFSEAWPDAQLEVSTRPDSMQSYIMDGLVDSYFRQVTLQQALHPTEPEAAMEAALSDLSQSAAVEKQRFGSGQEMGEGYQVYFRMVGYALLVLIFQFISSVQMVFGRREIRMRHGIAPLSQRRLILEIVCYGALISFGIVLLLMGIGYGMNQEYFASGGGRLTGLVLLNTAVFMLVAVGISVFCSQFTHSSTAQSMMSNCVALSLSFLGGLFVPLTMLSDPIRQAARLLPTYWYVDTFEKINSLSASSSLMPIWQGMLLQLAFAAAFLCLTMLVVHFRRAES